MADKAIELRLSFEEVERLSFTLSETLTWLDGLRFDVSDSVPVNTDIDIQPLQDFWNKLKDIAYLKDVVTV